MTKTPLHILLAILFLITNWGRHAPACVRPQDANPKRIRTTFSYTPDAGGSPTVKIALSKDITGNFLIDTGSGISQLSEKMVARLGLTPHLGFDDQNKPMILEGKQIEVAPINQVALGGYTLDIPFVVVSPARLASPNSPPLDGVIGANVLQDFGVFFDFRQHQITLFDHGNLSVQERELLGFKGVAPIPQRTPEEGVFLIEGWVNEQDKGDFVIDTGADGTSITTKMARKLNLKPMGKPIDRSTFLGTLKIDTSIVSSFRFGTETIKDQPLGYSRKPLPDSYPMQLGMDVLKRYWLLLDFPQQAAYFKHNDPTPSSSR